MQFKLFLFLAFCSTGLAGVAQNLPQVYNPRLFTTPLAYTAIHTQKTLTIDGKLNEADWQQATWSALFNDIEGDVKPRPAFTTRMKMLWDDSCLYVAAELQEPQLNASLLQHDTIVFYDNDFEIFIDPDNDTHQYFEIEVNALNTIFDLFMTRPYRNRADALIAYDVPGIRSAVQLKGTLNNTGDIDSGWTVEMAIPFRAINFGYHKSFAPPAGSFYRINFSRVEWDWEIINGNYSKRKNDLGRNLPEHNWVWSPQGVINMHFPERWGYVFFGIDRQTAYAIPASEAARNYLWLLYYKQQDYFKASKSYATDLKKLNIPAVFQISGTNYLLSLTGTALQFTAILTDDASKQSWTIDHMGKVAALAGVKP